MGFMDKAKKMAEQAQAKLEEAQKQFNSSQGAGGGQSSGAATDYDKHGRPVEPTGVTPDAAGAPPVATPGVPPTDTPSAPAQTGPTPDPGAPATPGAPAASPAGPAEPDRPGTEAPQVTHGDPLAG